MSVIDIEQSKQLSNSKGIVKTIDENALTMILDNVQIAQYVFPEASTVRELTSNAIDGQKEKERAIEILTGKAIVEDYYITREDSEGKYKDSQFNKDYYSLDHLDTINNRIKLSYIVGKEGVGWCDKFIIKDHGVGLGDNRLYGYMQIGYSSKRNTTGLLGGYGLGGKAGLSLRNDYFTTETVHNGRKFKFNCYSYKVDSLIGKFNTSTSKENPHIIFPDKSIIYYEPTTSLNYTEIAVPCKSHHKDKFKHAVESQLLYFDNIDFCIIDKSGNEDCKDVQADIIYNSENLIIADQYQYSKPHIVVVKDKKSAVGVSYGYCNFKEMEMQDMFGSVGFKCCLRQVVRDKDGKEIVLQEGIDCTPSRESIVWSDATRVYVKNIINGATEEANKLIENQLKEDDFLVWLDKAKNVLGNTGDNRILRQLTNIIDKTQLSPVYQVDISIKYGNIGLMLWGLNPRKIYKTKNYKTGKESIERLDIEDWNSFDANNCYLQLGSTNLAKDHYIIQTIGHQFTTIRLLDDESLQSYIKKDEVEVITNKDGSTTTTTKDNKWTKDYIAKLTAKRDRIVELIKVSKLFKSYDDIVVPEDWNKKFEESETITKENEKEEKLTPLELRKLAEQTIVHSLEKATVPDKKGLPFKWKKNTLKISDLKDDCCNVYYSYGDEDTVSLATILLWRMYADKSIGCLNPNNIKLYRVSKSMPKKFLKNHKHINELFKQETDTNKTMSRELIEWTTAKYIRENLDKLKFMRNYKLFNQEIAELYKEVKDYSIQKYADDFRDFTSKYPSGETFITSLLNYIGKITEFQLFVRDHKDDSSAIQQKSKELFGIETVTESVGYNLEMYDKMQILLNYAEPVKALFNHIDLLKDIKNLDIEADTESMIKDILEAKGLTTFKIPSNKPIDTVTDTQIEDVAVTTDSEVELTEIFKEEA